MKQLFPSELSLSELIEQYPDQDSARVWFEAKRWGKDKLPDICPYCQASNRVSQINNRSGVYRCLDCLKEFTVRTGTVMERSHIPLNKWIYATYLFASSRKRISSIQLAHQLGITQKSAWFMLQRLREAYANEDNEGKGSFSGIIAVDETCIDGR